MAQTLRDARQSVVSEPFRLLSKEEFQALTTAEKVEYLNRAMDAQKVVYDQIASHLSHLQEQTKPKEDK